MVYNRSQIHKKWMDPKFKFFVNRAGSIQGKTDFLKAEDRMKDEYLGACLDYIRWGSQTHVMYEFGTLGMIGFIQAWMELNSANLIWHEEALPEGFKLPVEGSLVSLEETLDALNVEPRYRRINCINPYGKCEKQNELSTDERRIYNLTRHCPGHKRENERTVHPFDGWDLARYVQKWHEQDSGKIPLFKS